MRANCSIASALAVWVLLVACAEVPSQIREHTYPRGFHYITQDEIKSTMSGLAYRVNQLDQVLRSETRTTAAERERAVELLIEMRTFAADLKSGERSSHPRIDRYAPLLAADIERAIQGARLDPPNFYPAGNVAGACTYCHVPRDLPAPTREPTPAPE